MSKRKKKSMQITLGRVSCVSEIIDSIVILCICVMGVGGVFILLITVHNC